MRKWANKMRIYTPEVALLESVVMHICSVLLCLLQMLLKGLTLASFTQHASHGSSLLQAPTYTAW